MDPVTSRKRLRDDNDEGMSQRKQPKTGVAAIVNDLMKLQSTDAMITWWGKIQNGLPKIVCGAIFTERYESVRQGIIRIAENELVNCLNSITFDNIV